MQGRPRVRATPSLEEELEIWPFRIGTTRLFRHCAGHNGPEATMSPWSRSEVWSELGGPRPGRGAVLWLRQGRYTLYPHTKGSCEEALWPGEVRGALRPQAAEEAHFRPECRSPGAPPETTD